jgi:hypothetical protein
MVLTYNVEGINKIRLLDFSRRMFWKVAILKTDVKIGGYSVWGLLQDSSSSFRPVQIPTAPFRAPATSDLPVNTNGPFQGPGYIEPASKYQWPLSRPRLHRTCQYKQLAREFTPALNPSTHADRSL